jgi:DNA modification methylase
MLFYLNRLRGYELETKILSLGSSHLYQGDYKETLSQIKNVRLIITSPPYNIGSAGKREDGMRGQGKFDHKSFSGINSYEDNLPETYYQEQQKEFLLWALDRLKPNGVIAYVHKNRHKDRRLISPYEWILPLVEQERLKIYEEVVWDRGSTHNHDKGYLYPETERIYILCKPDAKPFFQNYDPEGVHKGMSDVWRIGRARNSFHDAAFPLSLAERIVKCYSKPRELVVDPYCGSGTSFVAALNSKRRFIGSELSPSHFKNARKRVLDALQ